MSLNKPKTWKVLLVSLAAALSFSILSACSGKAENAEDTGTAVATYEGGTITAKEFELDQKIMKFLNPQQAQYLEIEAFREPVLKQEVAFEYLSGKASSEAKKEAEKEVDIEIEKMKKELGEGYESTLKEQGITEDEIRAYMVRILTVYQDMMLKVTDEQVKTEFEATKGDFTVATLRHVLIGLTDASNKERSKEDALKLANEVKTKLEGGADFAATVKEYSDDTASKEAGGEYKDKNLGTFVEEFKKTAQTLPLNTISDPVETSFGYHILKVESRTERTFDQLKAEEKEAIKSSLATKSLESFMEKEIEGIVKSINLPKSSAAPEEKGGANNGAAATPAPTAAATQEAPAATAAAE
ncbi:peptidylprolyl isomerase [Paenibacillus albidus]|uniref:peptidylprolyl isomerase n=1 Tax=Paenibacillus albidus TaxID=2041023 RepID=UPI001BE646CA|nr:peptidylprolyl isomerase [Paenibacillus albidus]MBT2290074.1 peptidylprolyl isomerase [Paenibacillus albidus]